MTPHPITLMTKPDQLTAGEKPERSEWRRYPASALVGRGATASAAAQSAETAAATVPAAKPRARAFSVEQSDFV